MFEELIKINNKLLILYKDKDSERLKRHIFISKLLTEKECFHIMNIETAYSVLRDLEIPESEIKPIYLKLLDQNKNA